MSILIKIDGTKEIIDPKDGNKFSLEELQEIVEGYIEFIHLPDRPDKTLVVNEEGKLINKEYNPAASILAQRPIVGQVALIDNSKIK